MQDAITQIMTHQWTPAVVAFLFGLIIGWIIWGAPWTKDRDHDAMDEGDLDGRIRREPLADAATKGTATTDSKVGSIEAEIAKVKSLLETEQETDTDLSAELEAVDKAVKRANGRLKLILKSVDRAKDTE